MDAASKVVGPRPVIGINTDPEQLVFLLSSIEIIVARLVAL